MLIGCTVHFSRSYQRVADRVSSSLDGADRKLSRDTFCMIAKAIPTAANKMCVMKLFSVLRGSIPLTDVAGLVPRLSEEHMKDGMTTFWDCASHWVDWWTRLPHLRMLCNVFSLRENGLRKETPKGTNGVERVNQDSKQEHSTGIVKAMEYLYKKDKVLALAYIAAERDASVTYRDSSEECRRRAAVKRR